ncbi:MAG: hypothetical protein ACP5RD_08520, partial [bacterium]
VHILIYPRDANGKKLRLKKDDLRNFHKEWDLFLQNEGYQIKRKNIGTKPYFQYMKEKTKEMGYLPIHSIAIDEELMKKGKESFLRKLKRLSKKLEDIEEAKKIKILIKKIEEDKIIMEDMIEKEAIKVAENQSIRKMMKTKEYLKPLENPLGKSLDKDNQIGNKDRNKDKGNKDNQNLNLNDNLFFDNWNNNRIKLR